MNQRRQLLKHALLFAALVKFKPALALGSPNGRRPKILGAKLLAPIISNHEEYTASSVPAMLNCYDIGDGGMVSIPIDCAAHGFGQSPVKPELVAAVAKWNPQAALIDLKTRVVRPLQAPDGHRFFGHLAFAPDGTLFVSAAEIGTHKGVLLAIDPETGKVKSRTPTGALAPHEFLFVDDRTVVVGNLGCVSWVDVRERKVLRTVAAPGSSHLKRWSPDSIVLGHRMKQGRPSYLEMALASGKMEIYPATKAYEKAVAQKGEALSLAVINEKLAAATTLQGNNLLFWDRDGHSGSALEFQDETHGLLHHDGVLWMTTGGAKLFRIDLDPAKPERSKISVAQGDFSNAMHLHLAWV